jgi:hypothetical protein
METKLSTYMSLLKMNREPTERNGMRKAPRRCLVALPITTLLMSAACSHAPEYSIFGSFFPVWIFCAFGGLLLMTAVRALIMRTVFAEHLAAPVLFYISVAIFLACMLWLVFYS